MFSILFFTALALIAALVAMLMYIPRLLRRKKMRQLAEKFSLKYRTTSQESFSIHHLFRSIFGQKRDWKENTISGAINGHQLEVCDSFRINWPGLAPGRSATYKETIWRIDNRDTRTLPASIPLLRGVASIKTIEEELLSLNKRT